MCTRIGRLHIRSSGTLTCSATIRSASHARPRSIVVGLGEEGTLTAADLVLTVRKGVIAWAERVAEQDEAPPTFNLAATLIGSGGKGMDVGQVAPLLAEAVSDADALLQTVELPRVGEFKIIELFLDRATDAWHALTDHAEHASHRYQVAPEIMPGSASLRPFRARTIAALSTIL